MKKKSSELALECSESKTSSFLWSIRRQNWPHAVPTIRCYSFAKYCCCCCYLRKAAVVNGCGDDARDDGGGDDCHYDCHYDWNAQGVLHSRRKQTIRHCIWSWQSGCLHQCRLIGRLADKRTSDSVYPGGRADVWPTRVAPDVKRKRCHEKSATSREEFRTRKPQALRARRTWWCCLPPSRPSSRRRNRFACVECLEKIASYKN